MRRILLLTLFLVIFVSPTLAQNTITDGVVYATAQPFESGLMIWRSDNSDIWVLPFDEPALYFSSINYSALPDNPIVGTPPHSLRPILGMGKVWGNHANVRALLGWPTGPEIGFSMGVRSFDGQHQLRQLDDTIIEIQPDGLWRRYPATDTAARVYELEVSPNPVRYGEKYTVSWKAEGAEMVIIEVYDANTNQQYGMFPDYPPIGSADIPVPDIASYRLSIVVWAATKVYGTSSYDYLTYNRLAQSSVTLDIDTRNFTGSTVSASFQRFENGFMVVTSSADPHDTRVYVLSYDGSYVMWTEPEFMTLPTDTVYAALVYPFSLVWNGDPATRSRLGAPLGDAQGYAATLTSQYGVLKSLTLPVGTTVYIHEGNTWGA